MRKPFHPVETLFLRLLGAVWLIAFVSFGVQARGLLGANGILPAGPWLDAVREHFGPRAYALVPTLFWLHAGDWALVAVSIAGSIAAVVLIAGFARRTMCALLFVFYLSIAKAGRTFWGFQWDSLLLETGFLAIFLGLEPHVAWLFRWLLFRLMFESGVVKLTSGDPNWRNLTALRYHWETQPLPTPLAWYASQLPDWFQKLATASVFFVEIVVPFFLFAPRRIRIVAAGFITFLQVLIFLTGNYTFFNVLTIALCVFALHDDKGAPASRFGRIAVALVAAVVGVIGLSQVSAALEMEPPAFLARVESAIQPFEIVNSYGLFANMTTERDEIFVEGSNDGAEWKEYVFRWKPQDLRKSPRWVAPYQPRLDWQMWFAALGNYQSNPWFVNFAKRLLEGSPEALGLLAQNPFAGKPPQYIRATTYRYQFTSFAERRQTGAWWKRELKGAYLPALSLRNFSN